MIYTLTLNPALDYTLKLGELNYDDINRAEEACISYGGKGINVSVILSRLGCESIATGFSGGFAGAKLEDLLEKENIKADFVHIKGETRINVKIRYASELDINAEGPQISDEELKALFKKLDEIKKGDMLILAGSIPKTLPDSIYESIMERLVKKGARFIVDAQGELLLKALKYKPFLIKPNHHELADIFGAEAMSEEDIIKYARKLREMGAKNVLVSLAENGAILVDENAAVHRMKNAEGALVNSVGCGDSMVAGFLFGYLEKGDYEYALRLGVACGNATAYSEGLATKEKIQEVLNQSFFSD